MGLNNQSLQTLQKHPYNNMYTSVQDIYQVNSQSGSSPGAPPSKFKYQDLESQAKSMMIINEGKLNKMRKQALPKNVMKNKDFTFGMQSQMDGSGKLTPGRYVGSQGKETTMDQIIGHTDNLMETLQKKIAEKIQMAEKKQ